MPALHPDKQARLRLTGLTSTVSALLQLWATTPPEKLNWMALLLPCKQPPSIRPSTLGRVNQL
ncbi:MAG: hypothetical protein R3E31_07680 [Chloroflexota bacterium]